MWSPHLTQENSVIYNSNSKKYWKSNYITQLENPTRKNCVNNNNNKTLEELSFLNWNGVIFNSAFFIYFKKKNCSWNKHNKLHQFWLKKTSMFTEVKERKFSVRCK